MPRPTYNTGKCMVNQLKPPGMKMILYCSLKKIVNLACATATDCVVMETITEANVRLDKHMEEQAKVSQGNHCAA